MLDELPAPFHSIDRRVVLLSSRRVTQPSDKSEATRSSISDALGPYSPTTSAGGMLVAVGLAFLLALLFSAPGLVHAANGMPDGIVRTVMLDLGQMAMKPAGALRLTGAWDELQLALGHPQQPAVPPLLGPATDSTLSSPPRHVPAISDRTRGRAANPASIGRVPSRVNENAPAAAARRTLGRPTRAPVAVPRSRFRHIRSRRRGALSPNHKAQPPHRLVVAGSHPAQQHVPPAGPLRAVTRRAPLRLLITGDSLPGYIGPELLSELARIGPVTGWTEVHDGTGLTRPDFVDWSVVAQQQVTRYHPDAVVVMLGGNDFQNMVVAHGRVLVAGTPAWTREYQRRAAICMRIWAQGGAGHRVYWLSMPPSRDASWAYDDARINLALGRAAATIRSAEYVNILGPITNRGQYADVVPVNGQPTLIREPDGVHLNISGSILVAHQMVPVIVREWHLR